jgi:hypothetical protein
MGKLSSLRPTSAKLRLAKQGFGRRSPALRDEDGLHCCHIFCPAMAGFTHFVPQLRRAPLRCGSSSPVGGSSTFAPATETNW